MLVQRFSEYSSVMGHVGGRLIVLVIVLSVVGHVGGGFSVLVNVLSVVRHVGGCFCVKD